MNKPPLILVGIISSIVIFITFLFSFLIFAFSQDINLVEKDYYSKDLEYQSKINVLNQTRLLENHIKIQLTDNKGITLTVPDNYQIHHITGNIQLYRPSDSSLDRFYGFKPIDGIQFIPTDGLEKGLWIVKISWNMNGQEYFNQKQIILN